jgi:hypothetical protein
MDGRGRSQKRVDLSVTSSQTSLTSSQKQRGLKHPCTYIPTAQAGCTQKFPDQKHTAAQSYLCTRKAVVTRKQVSIWKRIFSSYVRRNLSLDAWALSSLIYRKSSHMKTHSTAGFNVFTHQRSNFSIPLSLPPSSLSLTRLLHWPLNPSTLYSPIPNPRNCFPPKTHLLEQTRLRK